MGCYFNNFAVISQKGNVFVRENLEDEKDFLYYGKEDLYEINREYFG